MVLSDLHWLLKRSVDQTGSRFFTDTIIANQGQTSELMAKNIKARLDQ